MKPIVTKIIQVALAVASVAVPLASNYFSNKELDDQISKKAAEAVANALKHE